jgi:delta14-sterol reductase
MIFFYLGFMTYKEGLAWNFWAWLWNNYIQLQTAALVFSFLLACYVYTASFFTGELLAEHGNTGNPLYDVCAPSPS